MKTESESIEATVRRRRILFAGFAARTEDTRLPKCVMFGVWGQQKKCIGCLLKDLRASGIADQRMIAAQDEGGWRRTA